MATPTETLSSLTGRHAPATGRPAAAGRTSKAAHGAGPGSRPGSGLTRTWVRAQAINTTRHAAGLRPFRSDEFGTGAEAPTAGHLQAANKMIKGLRRGLLKISGRVRTSAERAAEQPTTPRLEAMVRRKARAHRWVRGIEKIWNFYFELFGQRQTRYAKWLLSCDRIALDCYRACYLGLGQAKPIPAPPPFCYMATGFAPATFRRGIPLKKLGKQFNPFPLVQLPAHRLTNPWTLGAVLHETGHNLQSDLGLSRDVPRKVGSSLLNKGIDRQVARVWVRWNREMFADMLAVLMGGPLIVGSLMDILAREPETVSHFNPRGPHPTPYFRTLINTELLRRMGFEAEAQAYKRLWLRIYPKPTRGSIPPKVLRSFLKACPVAVDAMCFQPYRALGNKSLYQVLNFGKKEQQMIEEAAARLANGTDPGIVPERFLIGAVRLALDRQHARPGVLTRNFYRALASG